jgi:CRISPR-associated protein Csb1
MEQENIRGEREILPLTATTLRELANSDGAAIRFTCLMQAAGGKVFPPTYPPDRRDQPPYAIEERHVHGSHEVSKVVLLDSVQSQANRMEAALEDACTRGQLALPLIVTDFADLVPACAGLRLSTLAAPHRIADAIFRDSSLEGVPFRETPRGRRYAQARVADATALLELCPQALVFGVWDSTGDRGGLGNKFARTLVSEIIGYDARIGKKTASRIDPLPISSKVLIYETEDGTWTLDERGAKRDKKSQLPVKVGKQGDTGRASAVNLGNIRPSITDGGVSIAYAEQRSVLSLPGLRRLRFPTSEGRHDDRREEAARFLLSALAVAGMALQYFGGYDLRSGCLLIPDDSLHFEYVPGGGRPSRWYEIDRNGVFATFREAVGAVRDAGFTWDDEPVVLNPMPKLVELVVRSLKDAGQENTE